MSSTTQTLIKTISTVCVTVSDSDRAIAFYCDKLGLEKRVDVPFGGDYRWVEVAPAGTETTIALAPPPPGRQAGGAQTGITLQTDDIDALHAEMRSLGVDVDEQVSRSGDPIPPLYWFRDPDANVLMVVEAR